MAGLRPPAGDIGVPRFRFGFAVALVAIFGLLLLGFSLLDRLGLDTGRVAQAESIAALVIILIVALISHGRRPVDYYVADRDVPPVAGGLAVGASLAGCSLIALLGATAIAGPMLLTWAAGAVLGLMFTAVAIAPGLRRFGGYTAGDFIAARFGTPARLAQSAASFCASLLIFVAQIKFAASLLGSLFPLSPENSVALAAALPVLVLLPGGLRSLTAAQLAQYLLAAVAVLVPAAYLAAGEAATLLPEEITPSVEDAGAGFALLPTFLVAAGVASLAPVLSHAAAAPSGRQASYTMLWAILVSVILLAGAVLLGGALAEAVGWEGPIQLLRDPIAATLSLASLPSALSGLLSAGALAATLAIGQAALFSAATTLSHEIWDEVLDPKGPTGRRIFLARLAAVGVAALGAWIAPATIVEAPALLLWGLAFAAAGSLAPTVLGLWWKRCNGLGAALGSAAGFLVAGWGFLGDVGAFPWSDGALATASGAASAAAIGTAAAFLATVGVSLLTPAPDAESQKLVGDLRRRGRPALRERPA